MYQCAVKSEDILRSQEFPIFCLWYSQEYQWENEVKEMLLRPEYHAFRCKRCKSVNIWRTPNAKRDL
jgi:hypothetical protein